MILNKKAQALIEFVLILPIILLLILGGIDLGRIVLRKSELENKVSDQITVWKNKKQSIYNLKESLKDKNTSVNIIKNETTSFYTIEVKEKINFLTPVISNILDSYTIKIKRVVSYE